MPEPIEDSKFRMEQLGMKQKDLAEVVGCKSRVIASFVKHKCYTNLTFKRQILSPLS